MNNVFPFLVYFAIEDESTAPQMMNVALLPKCDAMTLLTLAWQERVLNVEVKLVHGCTQGRK